ncbi:hypothetical protein SUGI_0281250 [Cryptomeria japonica]|nr:hypothetical protein SUGI_0281250 [Cryptomeria japonica]
MLHSFLCLRSNLTMLTSKFSSPSIPVECSVYYEFGQSSQDNNSIIERLEEIKSQKREEIRRREIEEFSGMEEFEEEKENKMGAEQLHSKEWSKMIEDTLKNQDWRRIMELAIFSHGNCEIEEVMEDHMCMDEKRDDNQVYVAVGKDPSALLWALNNLVKEGDTLILIHVFPLLKTIPSPVGKLPRYQVSQDLWDNYIKEEEGKRSRLLQDYRDMCLEAKVKTETISVENDMPHKQLIELISEYNIAKLVMGTKPATHPMTRKLKKKGPSKAEYVHRHAPHFCEVFVVCEGKIIFPKAEGEAKYSDASPSCATTISTRNIINEEPGDEAMHCMNFYRRFIRQ